MADHIRLGIVGPLWLFCCNGHNNRGHDRSFLLKGRTNAAIDLPQIVINLCVFSGSFVVGPCHDGQAPLGKTVGSKFQA